MQDAFKRFWILGRYAARFSNDLLAPPPGHMLALLQAAKDVPEIAQRFVHMFENPETYTEWLTDEAEAMRYFGEARRRVNHWRAHTPGRLHSWRTPIVMEHG